MSDTKVICRRSELVAVADATRSKTGRTDEMTLGEIASAITASGGEDSGSEWTELTLIQTRVDEPSNALTYNYTIDVSKYFGREFFIIVKDIVYRNSGCIFCIYINGTHGNEILKPIMGYDHTLTTTFYSDGRVVQGSIICEDASTYRPKYKIILGT